MSSISFFTPVTYGPLANASGKKLLEAVDDYFFLNGRKAQVLNPNNLGISEQVGYRYDEQPFYITALKVASYCTLIIPAIALIAKAILRTLIYEYKLTEETGYRYIGKVLPTNGTAAPQDDPSVPPGTNDKETAMIDADRVHTMTSEEILKLKLRFPKMKLPNNPFDSDFAEAGERYSDLKRYNESYFKVEIFKDRTSNEISYTVIRRKDGENDRVSFVPLHTPIPLTPKLLEELDMENVTYSNYSEGESSLTVYDGSMFRWLDVSSPGFEQGWIIRY